MQLILVCPLRLPVVLFTSLDMKMSEEYREKSTITAEDVQNLIKKKDEIEEQIKAYYDVLEDVSLLQCLRNYLFHATVMARYFC